MKMNEVTTDRIKGIIYGQAVGDALGLGTEFLTKAQVKEYYPLGLSRYGQILRDQHARRWARGSWTDDTDQMLCIFDSLLEKRQIDVLDIAARLHQWAVQGGMGIGRTVSAVLYAPDFLIDPHQAAKDVWEASGQKAAANGGIMRTSILGIWEYQQADRVQHNAEQVCRITHYDPRCVGSSVIVSLAISAYLQGHQDIDQIFQQAYAVAETYDPRIAAYLDRAQESLEALELDEGLNAAAGEFGKIGYTLKTMGAGFWALKHAPSFKAGILQIIHAGGDADTNAAVAGAMLGAKLGFSGLDQKLAHGLARKTLLDARIAQLIVIMSEEAV
jgi:ADP-ribosylglycohydrolase